MRVIAFGGAAIGALLLGAMMVVAAQGSVALPVLLIGALTVPAAFLFKPRIVSVGLFCFAALLPVEIVKGLMVDSSQVIVLSVSPADLVFMLLLPFWIGDRYLAGRDLGWTRGHTAFAAFLLWMMVATLFSRSVDSSLLMLLIYLKYFLFLVVIADLGRDPTFLRAMLWGAAAGIGLQIMIVGVETITGRQIVIQGAKQAVVGRNLVFAEAGGLRATRPSGLMNHPNSLAALMALLLPIALSLFLFARRQLPRLLMAGILLLAFVAGLTLLLTLSRGGWLAVAAAFLFILFVAMRKGMMMVRHGVAILAALAVVGVIAAASYPPIYLRLFGGDQGASTARVLLNDQAAMMVQENPIWGVGPGAYVKAAKTVIPPSFAGVSGPFRAELMKGFVHNKYLLTAAESGLVGLAIFLVMLWRWIIHPLRSIDAAADWRSALVLGLTGGMVAQAVTFFFEHVAFDVRIGLLVAAAGLAAALAARNRSAGAPA